MQSQLERRSYVDKNEAEMRETPQISNLSKKLASKKTNDVPLYLRYEEEIRKKNTNQAQIRQQIELQKAQEDQELTFRPQTNCSKTLDLKNSYVDESLDGHEVARQQKLAKLKMFYLIEETKELTFKPQINSRSERMVRPEDKSYFYDRMMSYHISKQEKVRQLDEELSNRKATFKPDLSKSQRSISATRRSYNIDYPHLSKSKDKQKSRAEKMKILLKQNNMKNKRCNKATDIALPNNQREQGVKKAKYTGSEEEDLLADYSHIKLVPNLHVSSSRNDVPKNRKEDEPKVKSYIYNSRKQNKTDILLSQESDQFNVGGSSYLYQERRLKPKFNF